MSPDRRNFHLEIDDIKGPLWVSSVVRYFSTWAAANDQQQPVKLMPGWPGIGI